MPDVVAPAAPAPATAGAAAPIPAAPQDCSRANRLPAATLPMLACQAAAADPAATPALPNPKTPRARGPPSAVSTVTPPPTASGTHQGGFAYLGGAMKMPTSSSTISSSCKMVHWWMEDGICACGSGTTYVRSNLTSGLQKLLGSNP
eukprot:1161688-Pelagomonas_calceolata.AAC.6